MRKLLLNLHLYATLVAGIFVVILGLTGSIIAFEAQLDRLFNPSLFDIAPQAAAPLPLSTLAAPCSADFPAAKSTALSWRNTPTPRTSLTSTPEQRSS